MNWTRPLVLDDFETVQFRISAGTRRELPAQKSRPVAQLDDLGKNEWYIRETRPLALIASFAVARSLVARSPARSVLGSISEFLTKKKLQMMSADMSDQAAAAAADPMDVDVSQSQVPTTTKVQVVEISGSKRIGQLPKGPKIVIPIADWNKLAARLSETEALQAALVECEAGRKRLAEDLEARPVGVRIPEWNSCLRERMHLQETVWNLEAANKRLEQEVEELPKTQARVEELAKECIRLHDVLDGTRSQLAECTRANDSCQLGMVRLKRSLKYWQERAGFKPVEPAAPEPEEDDADLVPVPLGSEVTPLADRRAKVRAAAAEAAPPVTYILIDDDQEADDEETEEPEEEEAEEPEEEEE